MFWKRLALAPIGLLMGLLILEGGLQIGAFFLKRSKRGELPVAWVTGNLRVLCLGDSNTYGLYLEDREKEAYPQQLEALWNARVAAPKLEVLNLGYPGTNSSRLARDLPRLLEALRPDILILMVGVNDFWTVPFPLDEAQATRPKASFLARHSLVHRLFYLIRRGRLADQIEFVEDPQGDLARGARPKARLGDVEFDMSFVRAEPGLWGDAQGLRQNLRLLVEQARAAGTDVYLMSYPAQRNFYIPANQAIASVAFETQVPLIELAAAFQPSCPTSDCPEMLYPDGHPKASGYTIAAEEIIKRLDGSRHR
jgi:lysophospholipase L1-like esterase